MLFAVSQYLTKIFREGEKSMYYVLFSVVTYAVLFVMQVFEILKFKRNVYKFKAISTIDRTTCILFIGIWMVYFLFIVDGCATYFYELGCGRRPSIPAICYFYILFWLGFHYLISQNLIAYNNTMLFMGTKQVELNNVHVRKVHLLPFNRMRIHIMSNNKYTLNVSRQEGQKLLMVFANSPE